MMILADESEQLSNLGAKIKVVGIGGCGCNAVNTLVKRGITGVELIGVNTDLQSLSQCKAPIKIQAGKNLTKGLGAGARPEIGQKAVEEVQGELEKLLQGSDLVFITAGMGKGTGTGGAPVVGSIAKKLGALVIAIVYTPFDFEGSNRIRAAEEGLKNLREVVDTLIVISNQKLLTLLGHSDILSAIEFGNEVLYNATRGITDIITKPGVINVDFNDVRTIMRDMGDAVLGTGVARGEHRAIEATQKAISNPLIEGLSIVGAKGVLVNFVGKGISGNELRDAVKVITEKTGEDVNLIYGVVDDESMNDELRVTVIATGLTTSTYSPKKTPTPSKKITSVYEKAENVQLGENLNVPTFIRRGIILNKDKKTSEIENEKGNENENDNPTFLKQVMD